MFSTSKAPEKIFNKKLKFKSQNKAIRGNFTHFRRAKSIEKNIAKR